MAKECKKTNKLAYIWKHMRPRGKRQQERPLKKWKQNWFSSSTEWNESYAYREWVFQTATSCSNYLLSVVLILDFHVSCSFRLRNDAMVRFRNRAKHVWRIIGAHLGKQYNFNTPAVDNKYYHAIRH